MAESARDWTKILRWLGDPDGPLPPVAPAGPGTADGAAAPDGNGANLGDAGQASIWSETLARVHGAADFLRAREQQLRDLEHAHGEAMARAGDRVAALEAQLAAEADRANRAEAAQAKAEEWLHSIHTAVLEQLAC